MKRYNPAEIEPKWQKVWEEQKTYKAHNDSKKKPYYALSMFPYPSGIGLHIGHARIYTTTDILARFMRMQGYEVMQPFGWDSFGLPAENYAIKTGIAPQVATKTNTDNFRAQAKHLGLSIDWDREFASTDPGYYRWTQWFFLLLHKRGLAYQKESPQFWCNLCMTVLANEQVVNGCCWRHEDTPVTKKTLKQWFFKITDYADRLAADLEPLDWPEGIKSMQRNWIGRSKGAEIDFAIDGREDKIKIFTTRADTLFGATFMVLAPEHSLASRLAAPDRQAEVDLYIKAAQTKTDVDRMDESRRKTGVFTGAYAINPVNGAKLPIWVADYVLGGYGTGAIMAVPAHDERDHAFATHFNLPIIEVIEPQTGTPQQDPEFRRSIVAIVRNPRTNEFLSINWGDKLGGNLFIGGGRDEQEDTVVCALREIKEETGYKNLQLVGKTGKIHHGYFAASKNVARQIEAHGLLFELQNEDRDKTALEADEQGKFTVEWLPQSEVEQKIKDELHATAYRILIKGECYHGEGVMANSGDYNGMQSADVREKIVEDLSAHGAKERINYKIRDWLISRQRYWGAPIPIVHCAKDGIVAVPEDQLPIELPNLTDFAPSGDGRSPLARVRDWVETTCPTCGGAAERETDTMDGFACSSWYFLRFADPKNNDAAFSRELAEKWLPVNTYVGGAEHAVMHLLYARMWTKVMYDEGLITFQEPFNALRSQGMLLAPDGGKFSKSKGNGVDPEDVINSGYGADSLRTVLMFLAPFDQKTPWSAEALGGVYRFLGRIWTIAQDIQAQAGGTAESAGLRRAVHAAIKKVTQDMHEMGYNTAISAIMQLVNDMYKLAKTDPFAEYGDDWNWAVKIIAQLVAPFAPHIAEELWQQCGGEGSVALSGWPAYDESLLVRDKVIIVVQVNGKVRAKLELPAGASQQNVTKAALADEHVKQFVLGEPKKVIYVPGKLLSLVV